MASSTRFNDTCTLCRNIYFWASDLFRHGKAVAKTQFHTLSRWKESTQSCHICSIALHKASNGNLSYLESLVNKGEVQKSTISVDIDPTRDPNTVRVLFRTPAIPILAELYIHIIQGRHASTTTPARSDPE